MAEKTNVFGALNAQVLESISDNSVSAMASTFITILFDWYY
jgi:hypothetical protein